MLEPGGNIEGKPEVEGVRSGKERRNKCVAVAVCANLALKDASCWPGSELPLTHHGTCGGARVSATAEGRQSWGGVCAGCVGVCAAKRSTDMDKRACMRLGSAPGIWNLREREVLRACDWGCSGLTAVGP